MTTVSTRYDTLPHIPRHHWSEGEGVLDLIRTKTAEAVARIGEPSAKLGGLVVVFYKSAKPCSPRILERSQRVGDSAEAVRLAAEYAEFRLDLGHPAPPGCRWVDEYRDDDDNDDDEKSRRPRPSLGIMLQSAEGRTLGRVIRSDVESVGWIATCEGLRNTHTPTEGDAIAAVNAAAAKLAE